MVNQSTRIAIILIVLVTGIELLGFFSPTALTWGFHYLGFLPAYEAALFCLLVVLCIIYSLKGNVEHHVDSIAKTMEQRPTVFLVVVGLLFVCIAVAFRITTPLLGDSFFIVKNFSDAIRGSAPLLFRNEPLATYYFWFIVHLYGAPTYAAFLKGFFIGELLLGIGFIITTFFIVRYCDIDRRMKFITFILLLVLPYMQLFFGYIETYAVVLFFLSVYTLVIVLYYRGTAPFVIVPIVFLALALIHYLALILFPSLLLLAYDEYRANGKRNLTSGFVAAAGTFIVLLMMVNFDLDQFTAAVPHHHYLSLTTAIDSADADSQAYTLFSSFHFLDLFNYFFLMAPMSIILIVIAATRGGMGIFEIGRAHV